MIVTREIAKNIRAACVEACGGRRKVEVGERHWPSQAEGQDGFNFLLWGADSDLDSTYDLAYMVKEKLPIRDAAGWVVLDCYCYNIAMFGREPTDALDCNVYVLLNPSGGIAYVSKLDVEHETGIDAILRNHGHEGYVAV